MVKEPQRWQKVWIWFASFVTAFYLLKRLEPQELYALIFFYLFVIQTMIDSTSFFLKKKSLCNNITWFQFFPEANEVKFAQNSVFGGTYFKLDYLTKPSLFEDFGFFERVKMSDRVKPEDELFLVAYPYFNVNGK